ncbi:TonB-dependent vitamin B12 receptor [Lysobacter antibioticus]|uniref:TonB-dependent vitamin B12 receptor n=1 Tax=Lysobacter antibioticus TaxID=84531 RepID=A0A0S2FFZ3_LYSAN|nr:TonB-dependent vitamin B12 receptor [Lysobacter antibioticus]ALN82463.1 tonB-dependent vitamin B12 receptor [Lysobacter antibioticus]
MSVRNTHATRALNLSFAIACALALPAAAIAAPAGDATDLDEVVVTANRTAVSVNDTLTPVDVLDRETIQRSQARDLNDLLRGRAGITISNQGGAGKLTTLFLRGSESDHVLVLVDGIRVGSPTSGLAALQDLPLALIDRIEIVRGPRSSLYGADAIGGVIQVFTRREKQGFAPRVHVGGGSNDSLEFGTGFGGRSERGWFGADYSFRKTEGINACRGAGFPVFAGCFTDEPDRDGYENHALSLRGGLEFNEQWSIEGQALRAEGENDYDGSFVNRSETVQQVIGGKLQWRPSETIHLQLLAGRNVDSSDNFLGEVPMGFFKTDRDSATLQGDFTLAEGHVLTAGFDWLRDRVDSDTVYDESERDNKAGFVQYQGRFGAQSFEASLRRDDNEQFGGHTTGGAAWGLNFAERWRVTVGYGTAFKAPTFNELYYPFFGNATLRPEESKTWELGLAYRGERFNARIDGFDTRADDLITYDSSINLPNNIDRARMRGAEIGIDTTFAQWTLAASASVLDTENRVGFYQGNDLPRRAKHSARIDLDRSFGKFRFGATAVGSGSRYDDVANSTRLGGYGTLDLRAEYAITPALSLQARVANVFDREYETSSYFNQPGREWFLTLRYAPVN